jgi:hypothetical protein
MVGSSRCWNSSIIDFSKSFILFVIFRCKGIKFRNIDEGNWRQVSKNYEKIDGFLFPIIQIVW